MSSRHTGALTVNDSDLWRVANPSAMKMAERLGYGSERKGRDYLFLKYPNRSPY